MKFTVYLCIILLSIAQGFDFDEYDPEFGRTKKRGLEEMSNINFSIHKS